MVIHPSAQQDLYNFGNFLNNLEIIGVQKDDAGVIIHASTNSADVFYVEVHGNSKPMSFPRTGFELPKPKT
jgi:hypothetical protein